MAWMVLQATIYFDSLNARCANLNQTLASAAMFLPAYQLRQRQQVQLNICSGPSVTLAKVSARSQELAGLMSEVAVARNNIVPTKKFSFASRKNRGAAQPASATTATPAPPELEPEAAAEIMAGISRAVVSC